MTAWSMSRLRSLWIILLLLVPASGFALIVGVHDAAFADELGSRTIGAGLAALGLVLGYCVTVLIERDIDVTLHANRDAKGGVLLARERTDKKTAEASDADAIGMFGCIIVVAISFYLVAAQVSGRYFGFWPFVQLGAFAAFFVASLVAVVQLWRRQREHGHKPSFRQFPVLGSAVSLGLAVGVLQFWYTNVYVPASAEPSLTITPAMGPVSVRSTPAGPRLLVSPRIDLENTSGARVEVVGAAYFLYGTCLYAPSPESAPAQAIKAMTGRASATLQGQQARSLVGFGTFLRQGQLLNPGETAHQFAVAILKPQSFDMASIAIYVVLARPTLHLGRQLRPITHQGATPKPAPDKPCAHLNPRVEHDFSNVPASIIYASEIQDHSWLHRLVRGQQYLQLAYSTFRGALPVTIHVSHHPYRRSPSGYDEAMSRLYGVTYDVARASAILPKVAP